MEGLAELIPLLLVGAYYLLQGRRRAAQRRAAERREEAPQAPLVDPEADRGGGLTPFQQFMEQLEEAVAEAAGDPPPEANRPTPPEPASAPAPPVLPTRLPPAPPPRPREFIPVEGSFDAAVPTDHVAHGFGIDNPLSEESFERRPAFSLRRQTRTAPFDPHGLKKPAPPAPARVSDMRVKLRDPKAARDAFVLQTIFGPRGGRRADRR